LTERSRGVKAILLDSLGTLVELQPPAPLLRAELSERFGVCINETEAQRAIAAEIAFYRRHLDDGRDERSLALLRERCAEALREALPEEAQRRLPSAPGLIEALLGSLRFRLYPDVRPALEHYRARGLRLVVISNWDVSLHAVLGALGLGPALDGIVTSAEARARKPSGVIFEQALHLAGVSGREAIHVGDSFEEDVVGARAAGIEPVLLRRDGVPAPPGVRSITSLGEVLGPEADRALQ
jgi:putative hydrolase of the HAD superfamily